MTTLDLQVASGPNDAHEFDDSTGFTHTGTTLRCQSSTTASARSNAGTRFSGVTIPAGAIISSNTYIDVVFPASSRDSPKLDILGEDADNAVAFDTDGDVTSRARTAASVAWDGSNLGSGSFVNSPSITTVIQEIVDRGGWSSGNAIVILSDGRNASVSESGTRYTPYDSVSASATKLHVEYSIPGAVVRNIRHPQLNPLIRR